MLGFRVWAFPKEGKLLFFFLGGGGPFKGLLFYLGYKRGSMIRYPSSHSPWILLRKRASILQPESPKSTRSLNPKTLEPLNPETPKP